MESTLVLIKPDGVKRKLIGEIISRFEKRGLTVEKMQLKTIPTSVAEKHYAEHQGKAFYNSLIEFITSGPLVSLEISGEQAVSVVRKMCGSTDSASAEPGTIRGDYSISKSFNIVHSSDSLESAQRELAIFFEL